jgi:hypothetical protein
MLSRRISTALEGALLCVATLSLEKKLLTFSPAEFARRS